MDSTFLVNLLYIVAGLSILVTICSLSYYFGRKSGYEQGYRHGHAVGRMQMQQHLRNKEKEAF